MSGYVTGDPYWLPDPPISFLQSSRQVPKPLRIAFATSILPFGEAALPCRQAVENIVQLMADLGHNVEPACPNFGPLVEPFTKVWQAGVAASGIPAEALSPMNRWILEQSGSAGEYLQAVRQMQLFARQIVGLFDGFDVLLLPTYMHPTIRVGEWSDLSPEETLERIINWVLPCPPFNASGNPAIALPTGFDSNGLPVGVQLVGKPADEITLISLAAQLEAVLPCKNNRPTFASL
jgi:amidase